MAGVGVVKCLYDACYYALLTGPESYVRRFTERMVKQNHASENPTSSLHFPMYT
jgi:hypothetical protein